MKKQTFEENPIVSEILKDTDDLIDEAEDEKKEEIPKPSEPPESPKPDLTEKSENGQREE